MHATRCVTRRREGTDADRPTAMTRAWMEFLALDRVEVSTEDGVDDASTVDANGRRKFFGERLEGWSRLDEGGDSSEFSRRARGVDARGGVVRV